MAFAHPDFLVSTDWLAECLADDDVRVFETTIFLHPRDGGGRRVESGRRDATYPRMDSTLLSRLFHSPSTNSLTLFFRPPSPPFLSSNQSSWCSSTLSR